jgi:hypothetical protein
MSRNVVVLHKGFLAYYRLEKLGHQACRLSLTRYTGTEDKTPPALINLHRERSGLWGGDVGSPQLLDDLSTGILTGGN